MVIQEPEEQNRVKELEERVRLLEWALAQAQLGAMYWRAWWQWRTRN
ncbi:MAG: hypothetical protein R2932_50295 [Caldilineaceae bacterium]